MSELTDEALFMAYRGGDASALEALVDRIRAPLFRTIVRHVRDRFLAEDILQETIERIIRHRGKYDPSSPFRGWAWKIAINRSIDHIRRRGREIYDDRIETRASADAGPEEQAAGRERVSKLARAL